MQRAQYADLKVYMPNDPLVKVDRMSMAHSLEIRCPLLDRRVVELAFRIPSRRHQQGTTGKVLLRKLAARRLPAALVNLPKKGFTVPIGEWIAGPYASRYRDEVLSPSARIRDILDVSCLDRWFEEHRDGNRRPQLRRSGRAGYWNAGCLRDRQRRPRPEHPPVATATRRRTSAAPRTKNVPGE